MKSQGRDRYLVMALALFGLALLVLVYATHAEAACRRPVTENGLVTDVSATYTIPQGRFVMGIGTATNHQFAFYTRRSIREGRRIVVSGCLNGAVIDNARWIR